MLLRAADWDAPRLLRIVRSNSLRLILLHHPANLPDTGFPRGGATRVNLGLSASKYTSAGLELVVPKLGAKMPIIGVPKTDAV